MFEYIEDRFVKARREASARLKTSTIFRKFARDEDGSLIIFSLFLLVMMLMITGMAVDLMRTETQRSRLQSTLDRAVLAGASLEQTLNSEAVVRDYFKKAGLGQFVESVTVVQGATEKTVRATAKTSVNTFFMGMLGINTLMAPASGQAEESLSDVEISLILDVSGSMGWSSSASGNRKIDDLIEAANEFVYLMQCDPDAQAPFNGVCVIEPDTVSISLVPYAEQVLVGESLLQQFNVTNEHTNSSCVDFDSSDFSSASISLSTTLKRSGRIDARRNYTGSPWSSSKYASNNYRSCRTDAYRTIVPFSNSYIALQNQISTLRAGGYTSIDVAMKWGTALLDPAFRPVVSTLASGGSPAVAAAFDGRPFDYGRPRTKKVVVLMTDGANTTLYSLKPAFRSGPAPFWINPADGHLSVYRASTNRYFWVNHDRWSNSPNGSGAVQVSYPDFWEYYNVDFYQEELWWLPDPVDYTGRTTKNAQLRAICDAAKTEGIEVFTLGFETSTASSAVLANCASSDAHHFDVDGTNISEAFNSIAREIQELRLTN